MRYVRGWLLAAALLPGATLAATQAFQCGAAHYVRFGGQELASTTFTVRDIDPAYTATIVRLTIRDGLGNVVHDSGPAAGVPLPLNTDFPNLFPSGRNITEVPPGGTVYLRSNHIWGNDGLPVGAAGNEVGQSLTATVLITKEGNKASVSVHATQRLRARVSGPFGFGEGETRGTSTIACEPTPW